MARQNAQAPLTTGALIRMVVSTRTVGNVAQTTHDYMLNTFPTNLYDAVLALMQSFNTAIMDFYMDCLTENTVFESLTGQAIDSLATPSRILFFSRTGVVDGNHLPAEVSAVVIKNTFLKGQHGRGRIAMPNVPSTFTNQASNPNLLTTNAILEYNDLGTALSQPLDAGADLSAIPVVVTRPPKGAQPTRAVQIRSVKANPILGTQRTRKFGRGI